MSKSGEILTEFLSEAFKHNVVYSSILQKALILTKSGVDYDWYEAKL